VARVYSPALTPSQFAQRKTGGSYGAYLQYLSKHRPGWDPNKPYATQSTPSPVVRGRLPSYEDLIRRVGVSAYLTPQQLEAQANRMAAAQVAAQRGIISSEWQQSQDDALRRMQAAAAAGRAAASMNASLIPYVGAGYRQGADLLSSMASGLAGGEAGAVAGDVAAGNAAASAVGAPQVGVGGPVGSPGIAGPTQAGVESYYGGTLPAQALTNAGGYAEAGLSGQIGAANLRATQEALATMRQSQFEADQTRAAAIKAMVTGRPALAMQFLSQLQDAQRQNIALAQGLIGSRNTLQEQLYQRGVTQTQLGQSQQQIDQAAANEATRHAEWQKTFAQSTAKANQEAARQGRAVDTTRSIALGHYVDVDGNAILKNGKQIPVPKTVASKVTGQPSQLEINRNILYDANHMIAPYIDRRGKLHGITRETVIAALWNMYRGSGVSRATVVAIANSVIPKTTTAVGTGTAPPIK